MVVRRRRQNSCRHLLKNFDDSFGGEISRLRIRSESNPILVSSSKILISKGHEPKMCHQVLYHERFLMQMGSSNEMDYSYDE
ncbi:hypothetical protein TNIN_220151 [Trichonephila inaurata madagascariensis]|uniref:Uncharacterized protein n=1 Tax=Trichonephila inaurata madagascariensis TaxID=2747483 RepID=A0A8X6XVJ3_9ARAC|nr:hypothetical protein TNIN_220151 [Trichonephila inaurata madagascariensis]